MVELEEGHEVITNLKYGIKVSIPTHGLNGQPFSALDMGINLAYIVDANYMMTEDKTVVKRAQPLTDDNIRIESELKKLNYPSAIPIPAPCAGAEPPTPIPFVEAPQAIKSLVKSIDITTFYQITGVMLPSAFFEQNIFKSKEGEGVPYDEKPKRDALGKPKILDLRTLAFIQYSKYNMSFTGCASGNYVRNSMEQVNAEQVLAGAAKLSTDTHTARKLPLHSEITARASKTISDTSGMTEMIGTFPGTITPEQIMGITQNAQKAGGLRPKNPEGRNVKIVIDPKNPKFQYNFFTNSCKADQDYYVKNLLIWAIQKTLVDGHFPEIHNFYKAVFKDELQAVMTNDPSEHASLDLKKRIFYVADAFSTLLSEVFSKNRIVNDRSTTLNGMGLTAGGGLRHFIRMGGKIIDGKPVVKKHVHYRECDGKSFDLVQHVDDIIAYCYDTLNLIAPDSPWYPVQKILCQEVIHRLTVKPTQFWGNYWFLIYGKVASGVKETASMDSWLMKLAFWRFYWYVYLTNPHRQSEMDESFAAGDLVVFTSGDDNESSCPDNLFDLLNMKNFANFTKLNYGMEIRNVYDRLPLLSVPDAFGNLSVRGVSIVKSYLIEAPKEMIDYLREIHVPECDLPFVVFYVKISDMYQKLFNVKSGRESNPEYLLKMICGAYRSGGVNFPMYNMCKEGYEYLHALIIKESIDVTKHFSHPENKRRIEAYGAKYNVSFNEMMNGFPSLETLWRKQIFSAESDFTGKGAYEGPSHKQYNPKYIPQGRYKIPQRVMDQIEENVRKPRITSRF